MIVEELTRRTFLQGSGTLVGSTLVRAGAPAFVAVSQAACSARDENAAFENIINERDSLAKDLASVQGSRTDVANRLEQQTTYLSLMQGQRLDLEKVIDNLKKELAAAISQTQTLESALEAERSAKADVETSLLALEDRLALVQKDAEAREVALTSALAETEKKIEAAEEALTQSRVQESNLASARSEIAARLEKQTMLLSETQTKNADLESRLASTERVLAALTAESESRAGEIKSLSATRDEITSELNKSRMDFDAYRRESEVSKGTLEVALQKSELNVQALGRDIAQLREAAAALETKLGQTSTERGAALDRIAELEKELARSNTDLDRLSSIFKETQIRATTLDAKSSELESRLQAEITSGRALRQELEATTTQRDALSSELDELSKQKNLIIERLEKQTSTLSETQSAKSSLEARARELDTMLQTALGDNAQLREVRGMLERSLASQTTKYESLATVHATLQEERGRLATQAEQLAAALEGSRRSEQKLEARIAELEQMIETARSEYKDADSRLVQTLSERDALTAEIRKIEQARSELLSEIRMRDQSMIKMRQDSELVRSESQRMINESAARDAALEAQMRRLENELTVTRTEKGTAETRLLATIEQRDNASARIAELQQTLAETERQAGGAVTAAQDELRRMNDAFLKTKEELDTMTRARQDFEAKYTSALQDRDAVKSALYTIESEKQKLDAKLTETYETLSRLTKDHKIAVDSRQHLDRRLQEQDAEVARLQRELAASEEFYKAEMNRLDGSVQQIARSSDNYLKVSQDLESQLRNAVEQRDKLQKEVTSLREHKDKMSAQLIDVYNALSKTTNDYERSQAARAEVEERLNEQTLEMQELLNQSQVYEANLQSQFKDINSALAKTTWVTIADEVEGEKRATRGALQKTPPRGTLHDEIRNFETNMKDMNSRLSKTSEDYETVQDMRVNLEQLLKDAKADRERLAAELARAKESREDMARHLENQSQALESSRSNEETLRTQLQSAESKMMDKESRFENRLLGLRQSAVEKTTSGIPSDPKVASQARPLTQGKSLMERILEERRADREPETKPDVDAEVEALPENTAKVLMIQPIENYVVLSTASVKNPKEGARWTLSKGGQAVYDVEVKSVYDSNISTARIVKRHSTTDLVKSDVIQVAPSK